MNEPTGSVRRLVARLVWAAVVIWGTLTVAFGLFWLVPSSRRSGLHGAATAGPVATYVSWLSEFLTFAWVTGEVGAAYADALPVTLVYVVPAIVVSLVVGTGLAMYAAINRDGLLDTTVSGLSAVALSIPAFALAWMFYAYMGYVLEWIYIYRPELGLWHPLNLSRLMVPATILALGLTGVQVRHVRNQTTEYLAEPYIKTVRAKGGGRLRIARHVFRNAWPAVLATIQGEVLALLVFSVIVIESLFIIDGAGYLVVRSFLRAAAQRSIVAVFGLVLVGVGTTVLREEIRARFDPRYE